MSIYIDNDVRTGEYPEPLAILGVDLASMSDQDVGVLLAELISGISEECYCAGWYTGVEWSAWAWADLAGPIDYGMGEVEADACRALNACKERLAGGWVHWFDVCKPKGLYLLDATEWHDAREAS